jgi:hypothetical protein
MRNLLMVGLLLFAWSGCSDDDTNNDAAADTSIADVVVGDKTCSEIQTCGLVCDTTECVTACIDTGCPTAKSVAGALFLCIQINCFTPVNDAGADAEADAAADDSGAGELCDVNPTGAGCIACMSEHCSEAMTACTDNTCGS